MRLLVVRIVSFISLFLVSFIAGVLPIKLRGKRQSDENYSTLQNQRRTLYLSLCSCFAGGAFFAITLLDLIPLVEKHFDGVFDNASINTDFPVAEFVISVGFFLILTLEQIILTVREKPSDGKGGNTAKSPLLGNDKPPRSYGLETSDTHELKNHPITAQRNGNKKSQPSSGSQNNGLNSSLRHEDNEINEDVHNGTSNDHEHNYSANIVKKHKLHSYLLVMALNIHALFEGVAIGSFEDIDDMVEVLAAVIIHKSILAFSSSVNLVRNNFPSSVVARSSFMFSAMSPVGFGIGILLLTYTSSNLGRIFSSVFQAIATGTFLYVTFFEIFFHELNSKECHKLLKVLLMILGYSTIAIVQYFGD